jgi:iron complex outermembrane recepter protein
MSAHPFKLAPVALATALAIGTVVSCAAMAQSAPTAASAEAVHTINLPAQALGAALNELARQVGLQLLVQRELVEGKRAPAIAGQLTARQALDRMLAGSGLTAQTDGPTVVLKPLPPPPMAGNQPEVSLQAVEVIGRAETQTFAETSFSTTKTQTHILDIPQSVSSVTKEVIGEQDLRTLNDIAPFVAGVNEFSVYDDLTIRGFRSSDDRRVNGLRTYNNFWTQPLVAHLEKVEVIKGPAAATFGDASPGGVINMVTKKPLKETRRTVEASVGSFDHRYAAADLTGPLNSDKSLLYRLNAATEDTGSFRNEVFRKRYTIAPSLSWLPSAQTRVNLDLVYSDSKGILDRGQPNIQGAQRLGIVPIEVSVTQPGDRLNQKSLNASLSLDHKLNDQWSFALAHQHHHYDERMNEHGLNSYLSPSVIDLYFNDRFSDAQVDSTSAYFSGKFNTGPLAHRMVIGVDRVVREDSGRNRWAENIGSFDLLAPEYRRRDTAAYVYYPFSLYGGETRTEALYVSDQLSFGRWELLAGLRHDRFKTMGYEDDVVTPAQSGRRTSPRLGAVYKLDDMTSAYASWIKGFEPPESWMNSPTYGGPFKPQDSELMEVGLKRLAMDGRLMLTAALYELTKNNAVVYANNPDNPDLYVQRGQERARGIEFEAKGQLTDAISVIANYAYNDAVISKDTDPSNIGKTKENAPKHAATIWSKYQWSNGWAAGLGVTHVGQRETFVQALQLPAYTVFNAGLYYSTRQLDYALTVKNLTDRTHWTGGYNFGRVFPGTPRSINLNVKYKF